MSTALFTFVSSAGSALREEQTGLIGKMQGKKSSELGNREYTTGSLQGNDRVCVLSRIGKVTASITVAT